MVRVYKWNFGEIYIVFSDVEVWVVWCVSVSSLNNIGVCVVKFMFSDVYVDV